jgi:hypothetical protein
LADVFDVGPKGDQITTPIPRGKVRPFSCAQVDFETARFGVRARGIEGHPFMTLSFAMGAKIRNNCLG